MKLGSQVEVRSRFDGSWSTGFVLEEEHRDDAGRVWRVVRRSSDGMVLPEAFPADAVRPAPRREAAWV